MLIDDDRGHGQGRVGDPALRRDTERAEECVEEPGRAVDPEPDEGDRRGRRHEGQEVRGPDPGDPPDLLVERDGQAQGEGQAHRHGHDGVEDGVPERLEEPVVAEQPGVVVQADDLRRRDQVPLREADPKRGQDRPGGEDRQADDRRREEQERPARLARARARRDGAGRARVARPAGLADTRQRGHADLPRPGASSDSDPHWPRSC